MPLGGKKNEKCGTCCKQVSVNDNGIQCEICELWYHIKCEDMSEQLYKALCTFQQDLHWYCSSCKKGANKLLTIVCRLQGRMDKMEEEMCRMQREAREGITQSEKKLELEKVTLRKENEKHILDVLEKVESVKSEVLRKVDQRVEELERRFQEEQSKTLNAQPLPKWSEVISKEVDEKFSTIRSEVINVGSAMEETRKQLNEQRDKESREHNIVIYNNNESRTENKEEWIKQERAFCLDLFNKALMVEVHNDDIKKVARLGKRDTSVKRPMLVEFRSKVLKNEIMESLRNLRNASEPFKGLVVSYDMTKGEREECKRLVETAKQREALEGQGEWIYRVRGAPGKLSIVKLAVRK